jgi:hypothetical protein
LVDAMKAAGLKRLIAVTGLGAGDSRGHGGLLYDVVVFPLLLKRVYDDKDVQEWIIKSSGLDWTIVRPGSCGSMNLSGAGKRDGRGVTRSMRFWMGLGSLGDIVMTRKVSLNHPDTTISY